MEQTQTSPVLDQSDINKSLKMTGLDAWIPKKGDNLSELSEPFELSDLEWKVQTCGKSKNGKFWAIIVPYLTARSIMDRLDKVVGPENWQDAYDFESSGGVVCSILIKTSNGWVSKQDGSDMTDIEAFKGGISGAFKRCAVKWGMGRELYNIKDQIFAQTSDKEKEGFNYAKTKHKEIFYWKVPDNWQPLGDIKQQKTQKPSVSASKTPVNTKPPTKNKTISKDKLKALHAIGAGLPRDVTTAIVKEAGFKLAQEITVDKYEQVKQKLSIKRDELKQVEKPKK